MAGNRSRYGGFTLVELLVVIAIIAVIASLVVPALISSREEAYKVQCTSSLGQIFKAAMLYSDKNYAFPHSPEPDARAHDHLNELLKSRHGRILKPELFVCPMSAQIPAVVDEEGMFLLENDTLSYAWVAKRTKNTAANVILASDKYYQGYEDEEGTHEGHKDMLMVLKTDSSVTEVDRGDVPEDTGLPEGLTR